MEEPVKKYKGRPKGVPNKERNQILTMLQDHAAKLWGVKDYDPLKSLLELAGDVTNNLSTKDRARCHEILGEYTHSKRKATNGNAVEDAEQIHLLVSWDDGSAES